MLCVGCKITPGSRKNEAAGTKPPRQGTYTCSHVRAAVEDFACLAQVNHTLRGDQTTSTRRIHARAQLIHDFEVHGVYSHERSLAAPSRTKLEEAAAFFQPSTRSVKQNEEKTRQKDMYRSLF